ncbi:MAG TPA: hypothetical protein VIY47_04795 [Ignavibacteriaceae bacterium]
MKKLMISTCVSFAALLFLYNEGMDRSQKERDIQAKERSALLVEINQLSPEQKILWTQGTVDLSNAGIHSSNGVSGSRKGNSFIIGEAKKLALEKQVLECAKKDQNSRIVGPGPNEKITYKSVFSVTCHD